MSAEDEDGEYQRQEREKYDRIADVGASLLPKMWHGLYANMVKEGFTKDEAMGLLKVYILGGQGGKLCT